MADRRPPLDEYVLPLVRYRSRLGVVAIAALALAAGIAGTAFGYGYPVDPALPLGLPWMSYVLVVGAAGCLLAKRAVPIVAVAGAGVIVVTDVAAVTGSLSLIPVLAFFDAIYAAMLDDRARIRRVVLAIAVAVGLVLVGVWLATGDVDPVRGLQLALSLALLIAAPTVWGLSVRQRDELLAAETARADAVARAADAERESAVRGERTAMARELHDELAARLSAIALQSAALAARAPADDATATAVRAIRSSSVEALDELRQLIGVLTTGRDDDAVAVGIDDAEVLRRDAERFAVDLDARVDVPPDAIATAASHALMRIARESLVNAARHAPGEPVRLRVEIADGVAALDASNALVPGATAGGNGLGIALMAQRWRAVGGSGSVGARDGRWVVRVEVPAAEVDA
ncbi:sensor histidine kinase [Agrococcus jejuensis]|uniref:sensor histidine kinase n=1 Tax=Agrococcus jejuensis TaxID=399736 RepID=UPI00119F5546|nr:histidine kinase [Agrococcus jejuensis]